MVSIIQRDLFSERSEVAPAEIVLVLTPPIGAARHPVTLPAEYSAKKQDRVKINCGRGVRKSGAENQSLRKAVAAAEASSSSDPTEGAEAG